MKTDKNRPVSSHRKDPPYTIKELIERIHSLECSRNTSKSKSLKGNVLFAEFGASTVEINTDLVFGEVELYSYLAVGKTFYVAKTNDIVLRRR